MNLGLPGSFILLLANPCFSRMENFLNSYCLEMWSLSVPASSASPKALWKVQMFGSHPRPTEFWSLHFHKIFGCFVWTLKLRSICLQSQVLQVSFLLREIRKWNCLSFSESQASRLPLCGPHSSHPWKTNTGKGVLENSRTVLSSMVAASHT